jgi:transcriptional regulator with XRE-family HTH domain
MVMAKPKVKNERAEWITKLGLTLKELRTARGWTTRQVALAAKVPQSTVIRYESGEREPRAYNLVRLAKALEAEFKIFKFLRHSIPDN